MENIEHQKFDISLHASIPDPELSKSEMARVYRDDWQLRPKTMGEIASLVTKFCWSPIIFKDGIRKSANFMDSQLVALDFDTPEYTLAEAERDWCDTIHIIGTTLSHQKEKNGIVCDRFRIISLWDDFIGAAKNYKPNLKTLMRENRACHADRSCVDLARFFFPCRKIVSVCKDGFKIATKEHRDEVRNFYSEYIEPGELSPFAVSYLMSTVPQGERNTKTFMFAKDCFRADYRDDEIYRMASGSPTYQGDPNYSEEIKRTILSAKRNLLEELRGKRRAV